MGRGDGSPRGGRQSNVAGLGGVFPAAGGVRELQEAAQLAHSGHSGNSGHSGMYSKDGFITIYNVACVLCIVSCR